MAFQHAMTPILGAQHLRKRLTKGVLFTVALVATVIYIFPLFWMLSTSLKAPADIMRDPPLIVPRSLNTGIYEELFGNPPEGAQVPVDGVRYMKNSLILGAGTMALTMLFAIPAAYGLARFRLRGSGLFVMMLLVTQMLPEVLLVIPLFVFFRSLHFTDSYISVIIADAALTLPFCILILRTGFLQVPRDLEEAALIDGTTRLGALRRVIVPLVRPNLVAVMLFAFLVGWGDFVFSLSFLQNQELHPLALGIYNFIGYYRIRWEGVMAFSTIIALPVIVIILALQRYFVTGLTAGSVK
ncbi:carbohydrate ABC transporter permease [Aggregatilinea lenta]|uniref:carbohydrate ABC transporter permease n=1 Tax=Aggregatilinea lenta TaxID=913108 RepID=UPI000E5A5190|nr:carbohydrate ABC transporter permease [Aggregatilinea lenta]